MKILVDGIIFGRQGYGGVSKVWEEYLKRLPQHDVKVKLLVPCYHRNSSLARVLMHKGGYETVRDYFYWPKRLFERVPVRSRLLNRQLDSSIQLFQSTYFSTVYSGKLPKVVMIHDMVSERFPEMFPIKWNKWNIQIKRAVLENADHIIAVSHHTKKDLLDINPAIPTGRVSVIHHGVNSLAGKPHLSLDTLIAEHGLDIHAGAYFLYVGLRNGYKNFNVLLDILTNNPAHRDFRFLCVGGEDLGDLPASLEAKGLRKNFIFLDFVPDEELATFYKNSIAFIYPSRYEGFGLPILEAMANECPVICSNTSSFPEIAGEAPFYFDPSSVDSLGDAIASLLKQDRNEIVAKGLRNVARFSWDESTKALVEVYKSLI